MRQPKKDEYIQINFRDGTYYVTALTGADAGEVIQETDEVHVECAMFHPEAYCVKGYYSDNPIAMVGGGPISFDKFKDLEGRPVERAEYASFITTENGTLQCWGRWLHYFETGEGEPSAAL